MNFQLLITLSCFVAFGLFVSYLGCLIVVASLFRTYQKIDTLVRDRELRRDRDKTVSPCKS